MFTHTNTPDNHKHIRSSICYDTNILSMSAGGIETGHVVWFSHPEESWILGVVKKIDASKDIYTIQPRERQYSVRYLKYLKRMTINECN